MVYTLKNGNAELTVNSLGAEILSYKVNDKEYIWTGDSKYWEGHSPTLFPFVSALKNNTVKYDNVPYSFDRKHGFARRSEFELVSKTNSSITMLLETNEKTKESYPYDFKLFITHSFDEFGYKTTYEVVNVGTSIMQFCLGAHPAFLIDKSVDNYELRFPKAENSDLYYTDEKSLISERYKYNRRIIGNKFDLDHNDFDIDCLIAKDLRSERVDLINKFDGTGISIDMSDFHVLVIWTPPHKNAPFICLEPCTGIAADVDETGNFEDKPYRKVLNGGESYNASYSVKII